MRRAVLSVAVLLLAVAACSGGGNKKSAASSSPPGQSGTQSTASDSSAPVNAQPDFLNGDYACSLITQDELAQIYGRPAKPLEPNGGRLFAFVGSDTSNCREETQDGRLILQFTIFRAHTADVAAAVWSATNGTPSILEPVPGVGDDAGYLASVGTVYATHQFEALQASVIDLDTSGIDLKSMDIAIAKLIASRMGSNASSTSECSVGADGLVPPGQRLSADDLAFEAGQDQGKYTGTWKNDTFGTSGTVEADVSFDLQARTVTINFQFKGDTLGIQGDGLSETAVIDVDRPVAHVHSNTLGDLVITRPLGRACPQHPTSAVADQPSNSSLSGVTANIPPTGNTVDATFDIKYSNGKTSTGSFTLRRQ